MSVIRCLILSLFTNITTLNGDLEENEGNGSLLKRHFKSNTQHYGPLWDGIVYRSPSLKVITQILIPTLMK